MKCMKKFCPKKLSSLGGFTLIELLVVITVIGILFGIGIAQYMNFNRAQILEQAAQDLKNNFRLAQTKASNGEKPLEGCNSLNGYRVKFTSDNPDNYTLVAVCNGEDVLNSEVKYNLPSVVKFSPLPSPILFKVLDQGTDLSSDLTINLVFTGTSLQKSVKVGQNGKIE